MRLIASPDARRDLRHIARRSEREWGLARQKLYLASIHEQFRILSESPEIGRPRDDLGDGYRSLPIGRHMIFYQVSRDVVRILRVLHQHMDANLHV